MEMKAGLTFSMYESEKLAKILENEAGIQPDFC